VRLWLLSGQRWLVQLQSMQRRQNHARDNERHRGGLSRRVSRLNSLIIDNPVSSDGEHLTEAGTCQPCSQGTYRTKGVHKQCVSCPEGTTTEMPGATKRMQCNTPKCVAGQFLVTSSKQCQFCPRGTFQDLDLQTTCKLCATDHTTASQGRVSK
jgi:CUB/sushi domain-containing protein